MIEQRRKATDMSTTTQATDNQGAKKGQVIVTLYKVEYLLSVDKDLSKNIKKLIYESNRGRSGYKSPSVEQIGLCLRGDKTKPVTEQMKRQLPWFNKGIRFPKIEFKQKSDGACNMPFIAVCFG